MHGEGNALPASRSWTPRTARPGGGPLRLPWCAGAEEKQPCRISPETGRRQKAPSRRRVRSEPCGWLARNGVRWLTARSGGRRCASRRVSLSAWPAGGGSGGAGKRSTSGPSSSAGKRRACLPDRRPKARRARRTKQQARAWGCREPVPRLLVPVPSASTCPLETPALCLAAYRQDIFAMKVAPPTQKTKKLCMAPCAPATTPWSTCQRR